MIKSYPHSVSAFTQGLVYEDGQLYESTGLYGRSMISIIDLQTGIVKKSRRLSAHHFGEGLAAIGGRLVQLTYRSGKGLVYSKDDLSLIDSFQYSTEGWGLAYDGAFLIMSDGSDRLYYLNPETYQRIRTVFVKKNKRPVHNINELEFIDGLIYANVWKTDKIIQINPDTGKVVGEINLSGLINRQKHLPFVNVLNGIAYDKINDRLFVTGKFWPKIHEIKLVPLLP